MYISYQEIMSRIERIEKGDVLYLNTDIVELYKVTRANGEKFNADIFLDTIIARVGEEGTILVPTFNWDFCKGITFDYRNTPSQTGALGNAALKRADFKRTKHPIYSFAVWGKDRELLYSYENTNSFGEGSIFAYMIEKKAKAFVIGLSSMRANTMIHHAEKLVEVPFRFSKNFTGKYIDTDGVESERTYSHYVRHLDSGAEEQSEPLADILERMNISQTQVINGIPFRTVLLPEMLELTMMDLKYNDCRNTYTYYGQKEKTYV